METKNNLIKIIDQSCLSAVPAEVARTYRIIPLKIQNNILHLVTDKNLDFSSINDLRLILNKQIEIVQWPKMDFEMALDNFYPYNPKARKLKFEIVQEKPEVSKSVLEHETEEVSIVEEVNHIISEAILQQASDIHIEPFEKQLRVRFRVDGVLQNRGAVKPSMKNAIISRLKIMADLDIAEKRRPQDGRIRVTDGNKAIDIRVSTLPTSFGEKVVFENP